MIFPTAYQIAFSSIKGLAVETASKLLEVVGSEERFFCLPEKELREKLGLHGEVATSKYRDALVEKAEKGTLCSVPVSLSGQTDKLRRSDKVYIWAEG